MELVYSTVDDMWLRGRERPFALLLILEFHCLGGGSDHLLLHPALDVGYGTKSGANRRVGARTFKIIRVVFTVCSMLIRNVFYLFLDLCLSLSIIYDEGSRGNLFQ